jgi:hypothetical protein
MRKTLLLRAYNEKLLLALCRTCIILIWSVRGHLFVNELSIPFYAILMKRREYFSSDNS